jgi:serine/threonine protein kinase
MLMTLVNVLKHVHKIGFVHRDVKPDNIYIDRKNKQHIILNDWSSAVKMNIECDLVGTILFSDPPTTINSNKHIPLPQLDLHSFVRTVFCLTKQRLPFIEINEPRQVNEYWQSIENTYCGFEEAMILAEKLDYDNMVESFRKKW